MPDLSNVMAARIALRVRELTHPGVSARDVQVVFADPNGASGSHGIEPKVRDAIEGELSEYGLRG